MTQYLQEFIYASEDFKEKSEKLAQSIEINSVLLSDSSTEKAEQRNSILSKLCRQAAQAKEAGIAMEMAIFTGNAGTGKRIYGSERPPVSAAERYPAVQRSGEGRWQMSSEITDAVQVIHILFEGTDLFLRVAGVGIKTLKQLAKLIMGILAKEKMEGKTSMKNLLKRGGDMHVFKFPQEQLKKVETMAKKYGILYSLLPDFNKDGMREIVFHAESLPRMNALIEKLKAGQVIGLEEYFQDTSGRDIDKFYEEMKERAAEMGTKEAENMQRNMGDKAYSVSGMGQEQKQPWMETGYLKMKDIEAIPLEQRLNILDHYQSGEYDPITITSKLVIKQTEDHVMVRLPRQSGKFIRIPIEE